MCYLGYSHGIGNTFMLTAGQHGKTSQACPFGTHIGKENDIWLTLKLFFRLLFKIFLNALTQSSE